MQSDTVAAVPRSHNHTAGRRGLSESQRSGLSLWAPARRTARRCGMAARVPSGTCGYSCVARGSDTSRLTHHLLGTCIPQITTHGACIFGIASMRRRVIMNHRDHLLPSAHHHQKRIILFPPPRAVIMSPPRLPRPLYVPPRPRTPPMAPKLPSSPVYALLPRMGLPP